MEAETFPDVTLANNSGIEQAQSTPNQNDGNLGKDTFVILRPDRKRYQVSLVQIFLFAFNVVLILTLAILITIFVTKHTIQSPDCKHASWVKSENRTKPNSTNPSIISITNNSSLHPWSGVRLPRSVKPSQYELHLQIDLVKFTYHGSVNITINIHSPTKHIIFHRNEIEIDSETVLVSSRYSPNSIIVRQFHYPENNFHVLEMEKVLESSTTYVVTVGQFRGKIQSDLRGLYLSSYKNHKGDTRYLAVTQFQAMDARRVFPCFDEPAFKARFKISVTYQTGYTALTNMPATSITVLGANWIKNDFETTPIMSTYILAIVVSDFRSRNYTFNNGYELKIWARPDAYSQTEYALEFARKCYEFFTDYFGVSDVVPKADHVAVPDFSAGAMENWGLVVYREGFLLYDRHISSSLNKYAVTFVVAHEIAHTWFGNMVTMEWWDDLWLNEGFANLLMYLAIDHVYPQWNVFAIVVVDDIHPVMVEDALTTSHSVSSKINNPEEINQRFDSISYNKGMAVLRMMMSFAGEERFKNGLRLYIERYRFRNADMSQLWAVFTEAFNYTYNIAMIMDTWTRQMGYPVVTIEDKGDTFLLHQERFLLDQTMRNETTEETNPFGYKWHIPFTYVTHELPGDRKTVWLNLGSASLPKPGNGWLLGNYEVVGFFRVMYDKRTWGLLADQLMKNHTVIPEANRAALIGDAFALARANLLDYEIAFNLTRYLRKEQSYIPWQSFQHSVEFIRGMIVNRPAFVLLQNYIQELITPVFDIVGASDKGELPERYLRRVILTLACDIGMEKTVSYAKSMFANWMKHDTRLPPDLSTLIYAVGIREGGVVEWDYVWNKTQSMDVSAGVEIFMESLAHTQKPWLLWRYINWLFDQDKIRFQNVRSVVSFFMKTSLARIIALEFLMSRWDDIVKKFNIDPSLVGDVIVKTTMFVNTEFHLKQLKALFKDSTPKSATTAVQNSFALIRANIVWMNDNYEEITTWLEAQKT